MTDKLSPADAKWVAAARRDFIKRVSKTVGSDHELIALRAELDEAYGYATRFLAAFLENNDMQPVEMLPTLCGVLTQIDNATCITKALRAECVKLVGELDKALHDADKFKWQVRDTCARAEAGERAVAAQATQIAALRSVVLSIDPRHAMVSRDSSLSWVEWNVLRDAALEMSGGGG